jgi:hypothetical protein
MRVVHIMMSVAIEGAPRAGKLKISETQASRQRKGVDALQRQGVILIVRLLAFSGKLQRVRVIVDRFDLSYLSSERGIGGGLSQRVYRGGQNNQEQK